MPLAVPPDLKITVYRFYSGGLNSPDKIGVIPTLLVDDEDTAPGAGRRCPWR